MSPGPSAHLVFLDDRAQARWAHEHLALDAQTRLVGVTAEALQALEDEDLPHDAVSALADTRQLGPASIDFNRDSFALAIEIETYLAQRHPAVRFDGPGFLSGQGYHLQHAVASIATRALLMRDSIRACSPTEVTVLTTEIDPWFAGEGYVRDPWLEVVEDLAREREIRLQVVVCPPEAPGRPPGRWSAVPGRALRYMRRVAVSRARLTRQQVRDLAGMRLLMADHVGNDWEPVLGALWPGREVDCFRITGRFVDGRAWTYYYEASLAHLWRPKTQALAGAMPQADDAEARTLVDLFEAWVRQRAPKLEVLNMQLFPALAPLLRAMAAGSPALARHADAIARQALDLARPQVVCFVGMASLAAKRLAYQCRQRAIPVVCYQHGGVYGTHRSPGVEQIGTPDADYFLTYGTGIRPGVQPTFPIRAKFIPVGSARVEMMRARRAPAAPRSGQPIQVLWVSEASTHNTVGGPYQVEDTERYLRQKLCLEQLSQAEGLRVTFRPFVVHLPWQGTPRWLERQHLPRVRMDAASPLEALVRAHDVVCIDTHSNTTWNEVLAARKPLILYCDPRQSLLRPHFMADLEKACCWCQSAEALLAAVRRLAGDGPAFLAELLQIDSTPFVRNYVLHCDDGQSAARVLAVLRKLAVGGAAVAALEQVSPAA